MLTVLFLVLSPLLIILGLYIGAGIYHLLVLLFVGPTGTGFEATLRVFAYTSAIDLLSWIPVAGMLAGLYGFYLTFVGIREMHETSSGHAFAVILLQMVLLVAPLLRVFRGLERVLERLERRSATRGAYGR